MDINKNDIPLSDKQALINMAVYFVNELRKAGKSDDEIENKLKDFNFSDILIDQILF